MSSEFPSIDKANNSPVYSWFFDACARFLKWLEVDRAVGYAILAKLCSLFSVPITILLIALFLTPEVQGFYYTFQSLILLQTFVELGFCVVVTQFASHEWAHLSLDNEGRIAGGDKALSRLASLGRLVFKWYAAAALLFVLLVGFGGHWFLSLAQAPGVGWQAPWFTLVAISALQLWVMPFLSLLEGCNQVASVYFFRLIQIVLSPLLMWLVMYLGGGLWMAAASAGTVLFVSLVCVGIRYRRFFESLFAVSSRTVICWRTEVWPMQWRIALGMTLNYLMTSFYTPLMFYYHGPVVAGQMGVTWQFVVALGSLSMAWVTTKSPRYGMLVAEKKYDELDRYFFKSSAVSMAVVSIGAMALWLLVHGLNSIQHPLSERMLPPLSTGLLSLAIVLGQITQCQFVYLRAHKREPFLVLTVAGSLLNGVLVWFLGSRHGPLGVGAGFLISTCLVWVPAGTVIWTRCRNKWHQAEKV